MKKVVLSVLTAAAFSSTSVLWAQTEPTPVYISESEPINESLDNLVRDYNYPKPATSVYDTLLLNVNGFKPTDIPYYTDAQVIQKLKEIPTTIDLPFNQHVRKYIDLYTRDRRDHMSKILGLQALYFPIFEAELERAGLPHELKYLAIVESALNPHAVSRSGATGLWQFMYATGSEYGLEINTYIDERKDPYKSSRAAAEYLKRSFNEFGDWMLAIASYNCGAGAVRRAITRAGGKRDYWAIRSLLPRETQGYVPAYVAAVYSFYYSAQHNVYPTYVDFSLANNDTVHIRYMDITLAEIAALTGVAPEVLTNMNPELKQKRIAYSPIPYPLRAPAQVAGYLAANESTLRMQYSNRRLQQPQTSQPTYAVAPEQGQPVAQTSASRTRYVDAAPKGKATYYTVKSGDVVGEIADRYGVSASDIAEWNNLYRYRISPGQKLRIYADQNTSYAVAASNRPAATPREGSVTVEALRPKQASFGQQKYHTVRSGDNLWDISKRYGTTVENIRKLNPGQTAALKPGQTLRVK